MVDVPDAMRVLLVEDEEDLGLALKQVLVREKYVVDWVTDGAQAWHCLESQWTDYTVAIVDWLLPELSGLELCQRLRLHQNPLPVLMLTALGQPKNRVAGLDAGADDYLVKPFVMEELLARLRALQRRSPQLQPQTLTVGAFTLDYANNALCIGLAQPPQTIPLTVKEFQVLAYLMQNPDQIIAGSKIRHQLWDLEEEPISNVVAAQMRLLRRKLASYGCDCPIKTVPGQGYRFNTSPHLSLDKVDEGRVLVGGYSPQQTRMSTQRPAQGNAEQLVTHTNNPATKLRATP